MKNYSTLLSTETLYQHHTNKDWAIFDCRFGLADTEKGRRDYLAAHIPGAVYVHLEEELSGPILPGMTGRHPLPSIEATVAKFSDLGIDQSVQVVVYDDNGGFIAARLWWMCRWLGHQAAAVLDGGWQAWKNASFPVESGPGSRAPREFRPRPRPELVVTAVDILDSLKNPSVKIVDSRSQIRFQGREEPIDPVAGRIPGAVNAPNADNIGLDGLYLSQHALKARFDNILEGTPPENSVFYCGSGVSAARNLLAMAHAGLGDGRLYAGSWSDWITDPNRPVARD